MNKIYINLKVLLVLATQYLYLIHLKLPILLWLFYSVKGWLYIRLAVFRSKC